MPWLLAAVVGLIALAVVADWHETQRCHDHGGHIVSKTGIGITGGGNVATTSTSFCLSADGRIIE